MECCYCKNILKTTSALKQHQKTTKYCLDIQGNKSAIYCCEYCKENFTLKSIFEKHLNRCKAKKNNEFDQTKQEISNLREQLKAFENIRDELLVTKNQLQEALQREKDIQNRYDKLAQTLAKKPTSVHNNTTTNTNNTVMMMKPFDMNDKEVISKAISDSFNQNHLLCGQKGVAKFAAQYLLKDENGDPKYICTDPSRQVYKFKTPSGEIEKDLKANKLTIALMDSNMIGKSHNIAMEKLRERPTDMNVFCLYTENFNEIKNMLDDNTEFRGELANLTCN
jgi:hypothetical protein